MQVVRLFPIAEGTRRRRAGGRAAFILWCAVLRGGLSIVGAALIEARAHARSGIDGGPLYRKCSSMECILRPLVSGANEREADGCAHRCRDGGGLMD